MVGAGIPLNHRISYIVTQPGKLPPTHLLADKYTAVLQMIRASGS